MAVEWRQCLMYLDMRVEVLIVLTLAALMGRADGADPYGLVRGAEFRSAWSSDVSARFDRRTLVQVMDEICGTRRIAWVIDRRLDPEQSLSSELPHSPLSELLSHLLNTAQAGAVVIGQSVIVGPQDKLIDLRTLAEVQRLELQQAKLTVSRKQVLAQPMELHWDDLTEPRQLAQQIAQRAKIELVGLDQIPYDQWRGGDLVGVTAGEALTVLAWQFDLQLKWQEDGRAALVSKIVPVQVTRTFTVAETRREAMKTQFPQLVFNIEGKSIRVSGRVEELEEVESWLKGSQNSIRPPKPKKEPRNWKNRTFTLRIKNAPLRDVLATLKQQGIPLEWDEEALIAAGVDMQARIEIDLKNATSEELLSELCRSGKLRYTVTESNAKLFTP